MTQTERKWKVDTIPGYVSIHVWMKRNFGKASMCENCFVIGRSRYEWSNISGEYKKERSDWRQLCVPCHRKADMTDETRKKLSLAKKGILPARIQLKPVRQVDRDGVVIAEYPSVKEAAETSGVLRTAIQNVLAGKSRTAGGFTWLSLNKI